MEMKQDVNNGPSNDLKPEDLSFESKPTTPDMENVMKQPSEPVTDSGTKAGAGIRFVAFMIDWFLVTAVVGLLGSFMGFGNVNVSNGGYNADVSGFGSLLVLAYFIVMDVKYGATLGKKVFKLKVVDSTTGENLDWGKAILREFIGRFLSSLVIGLGYLWIIWDKDKQGWHDKIGGSYVVKE